VDCFRHCEQLATVTFAAESNLARIHIGAFELCGSLISICIPSSVQTIGARCFEGCARLSTVTLPADSRLSDIAGSAFHECPSLNPICVPPRVANILRNCGLGPWLIAGQSSGNLAPGRSSGRSKVVKPSLRRS
jgi:hypothetical protein